MSGPWYEETGPSNENVKKISAKTWKTNRNFRIRTTRIRFFSCRKCDSIEYKDCTCYRNERSQFYSCRTWSRC